MYSYRKILYLSCVSNGLAALEQLSPALGVLLQGSPQPLMSAYYTQAAEAVASEKLPTNMVLCQPPGMELGCAEALQRAQEAFKRLFSDKSFLPERSRSEGDPEDIDLGA